MELLFHEVPRDDLQAIETAEWVVASLARLSDDLREIVELKIYGDLTFREISEVTGLPQGTVATRYRSALEDAPPDGEGVTMNDNDIERRLRQVTPRGRITRASSRVLAAVADQLRTGTPLPSRRAAPPRAGRRRQSAGQPGSQLLGECHDRSSSGDRARSAARSPDRPRRSPPKLLPSPIRHRAMGLRAARSKPSRRR